MTNTQHLFTGSIPENYDKYLGPLILAEYAADLARRLTVPAGGCVLETAAGTGIVTRHLRDTLPADVRIVATDLNEPMLEYAKTKFGPADSVEFQPADALSLPFPEQAFDAVVCQFGLMFFPDKLRALREARRVLKPGGTLLFNVWDSLEHNHLVRTVIETLAILFPTDPPTFFQIPFGYYSLDTIKDVVSEAGFGDIDMAVLPRESTSPTAHHVALGYVAGTPLSLQLADRSTPSLADTILAVEQAVASAHGSAPVSAKMQALVIQAENPQVGKKGGHDVAPDYGHRGPAQPAS